MRFLTTIVSGVLLVSCARMEDGLLVPESLPWRATAKGGVAWSIPPDIIASVTIGYDSVDRADLVMMLFNFLDARAEATDVRGVAFIGDGTNRYFDQKTLQLARYPGLRRAMLSPLSGRFNGDSLTDAIYHLYYDDSIVVGVHGWGPSDRWLARMTVSRTDHHALMPLALWRRPSDGHRIYVCRKSNRLRSSGPSAVDTLCWFDFDCGRQILNLPVGASFASEMRPYQFDSLLILKSFNSENGLEYAGFDDSHPYIIAYRPDGSMVWADTLQYSKKEYWTVTTVVDALGKNWFLQLGRDSATGRAMTTVSVRDRVTRDTVDRFTLPIELGPESLFTRHPNGRAEFYCCDVDGVLWAFDSTFRPLRSERTPFASGLIGEVEVLENEQSGGFLGGERFVDVNRDDVNDVMMTAANGQIIMIDGATLEPLAVVGPYQRFRRCGFVRQRNGTVAVIVHSGDVLETVEIVETSFIERMAVHGDRIMTVFLLAIVLPVGGYSLWRIEYFRRLFRLLISESDQQGIVLAKMKPSATLFDLFRGRRVAEPQVSVIAVNERAERMFGMDRMQRPRIDDLPIEVGSAIVDCLRCGAEGRTEMSLSSTGVVRHLVIDVRSTRLLGRFRRCVATVTDITESIEAERQRSLAIAEADRQREVASAAERRRDLAQAEAERQREMFTTTVKIVHEAKTPLQTAQLTLGSLMMDLEEMESPRSRLLLNEQRATIESSIVEAVDIINRCIYLAREDQIGRGAQPMNLRLVVQEWLDKIGMRYSGRGFRIRNLIPDVVPQVMLHRRGFEFLLQCAFDNAAQWTPHDRSEKTITVNGAACGGSIVLSIADNGIGMDAETVRRALQEPGFTNREMGSGLGLLVIHKSCVEHGARLSIESVVGVGTTLSVEFPLRMERHE